MPEHVVIIGSGPAGWAAAIYAARANLHPLVFEGAETEENRVAGTLPLGQLNLMRQQAENFGTRIITDDVVEVDLSKPPYQLKTLEGKTHEAHTIIIATG